MRANVTVTIEAGPAELSNVSPAAEYALCRNCGRSSVDPYSRFAGLRTYGGSIENDTVQRACPYCGGWADILNMQSVEVGDGTIYSANPAMLDAWARLARRALEDASANEREQLRTALEQLREETNGEVLASRMEALSERWHLIAKFIRPKSGAEVVGYVIALLTMIDWWVHPLT